MKTFCSSVLSALFLIFILMGDALADGCGTAHSPGRLTLSLKSRSFDRTALLYVPTNYHPDQATPLVIDLHGSASDASEQMDRGMWERLAEINGFVVAELQGKMTAEPSGWRWNVPGVTGPGGPDDESYISDAIDFIAGQFCVDRSRVYGSGYSGGARMLAQFTCDQPSKLAAVGFVAGIRAGFPKDSPEGPVPDPETCKPNAPVRIVAFGGLADPVNPYADGGADYWKYGVEKALARWAAIDRCGEKPTDIRYSNNIDIITYEGCSAGSSLVYYKIKDGGHVWPGSANYLRQPKLGKVTFEIDATNIMWDYFKGYIR